ncbi:MAG: hypothetical protein GF353_25570 [Candidatus Lokiarchaeota archaeon]|nr:hypothetical protein [Candidatus Lokiarchaeota archaeon]
MNKRVPRFLTEKKEESEEKLDEFADPLTTILLGSSFMLDKYENILSDQIIEILRGILIKGEQIKAILENFNVKIMLKKANLFDTNQRNQEKRQLNF